MVFARIMEFLRVALAARDKPFSTPRRRLPLPGPRIDAEAKPTMQRKALPTKNDFGAATGAGDKI
jgi:hypothetical protein